MAIMYIHLLKTRDPAHAERGLKQMKPPRTYTQEEQRKWRRKQERESDLYGALTYLHIMYNNPENGYTKSYLVDGNNEKFVLEEFWGQVAMLPTPHAIIAGWDIKRTWATLINKSLRHNVRTPDWGRQNLYKQYSDTTLADLSQIYLQGVSRLGRPCPSVEDCLLLWTGVETESDEFMRKLLAQGNRDSLDEVMYQRVSLLHDVHVRYAGG